ncbi:uncharacterized protein B0P05DRAFT_560746 [Gilbertella persicaria]|uniref:uncharacterized protein n=1 Tax=Gilbertella persicaria TaxID=101096 RepID=UPI002220E088|nr:uncharacterized protein B0P05DRAFT_566165 [Gilbertella persicaria]XP_051429465.1 uncharacterized protein B0P05DRAFT_564918 [Gilbertella persicaria]XP_051430345.1 uncharacterized protein B0P05DRAFT_560746 [Gilbertella persicaria]KAI8047409.1 hypothetical protein B0P05DRAFT_566165 [Gilbertella persicaria]KAI8048063.1 hypothetical protein B0P05DRAFT_564918 [Gilbertella persicaria]KAI8054923.1 hypothetical protein B0P05DRAFT_560746 [Gilbertella persicaria]
MSTELSISKEKPLLYTKDRLLRLYGLDLFAAFSSAAMVSPFIAIVDRSIIENLNGKRQLTDGLKYGLRSFLSNPFQFTVSPQFRIVLGLYFSTYTTANLVETTCENYSVDPVKTSLYKFITTSITNIGLCVYKDKVFARMFGFTAPPYIASWLQQTASFSQKSSQVAAQLACPAIVQLASTPVHLYALDIYNRPGATIANRTFLIRKEYLKSTLARIGRIGPAFGIGGVGNTFIRSYRSRI